MKKTTKFVARKLFELFMLFPVFLLGVIALMVYEFLDMEPDNWPRLNKFIDTVMNWVEGVWYRLKN